MNTWTLNRIPGKDLDDPNSYQRASWASSFKSSDDQLWVPTDRTGAGPEGHDVFIYWPEGGLSWATPYVASLAALAFQVHPDITPDEIVEQLLNTATRTDAGHIVNPPGFIEAVKKLKATATSKPAP